MEKITRGGKRIGAGRKPTGKKKSTVTLYVEREVVFKFGSLDKLKVGLYQYMADFGKQTDSKPQEAAKTVNAPIEPSFKAAPYLAPANAFVSIPVLMAKYFQRKRECETKEEWYSLLAEIENDEHLNSKQKQLLKTTQQ